MPARVKHKAITAGVVGGILFFIVAIILSVCAVKICNKRKRRKQEKGKIFKLIPTPQIIYTKLACAENFNKFLFPVAAYNMVACRITDSRNGGGTTESQVPLKK